MTNSFSSKASQDYLIEDHGFGTLQFYYFLISEAVLFLNVYQKSM